MIWAIYIPIIANGAVITTNESVKQIIRIVTDLSFIFLVSGVIRILFFAKIRWINIVLMINSALKGIIDYKYVWTYKKT